MIIDVFREVAQQVRAGFTATIAQCMLGWLLASRVQHISVHRGWIGRQEYFGQLGVYILGYVLWLLYWKLWLFL